MYSDFFSHIMIILLLVTGILIFFAKMRLPSVLGYLTAGVLAGPEVFRLLANEKEMEFLSQMGMILMMFMIGLDFSWSKLKRNLRMVIGLGAACTGAITAVIMLIMVKCYGFGIPAAFLIGGAVAMSSTAVLSRQLMDQKEFYDSHGKMAFGITLFQDFAAIIFLALIPGMTHAGNPMDMMRDLSIALGTVVVVLAAIYLFGRRVELSLMRFIGALKSSEIFILVTLLTIMGAAWISEVMNLSALLGVFLAGMVIGETEFKHKVEDDLKPFHDIMIGVFFMVMGMMLKLSVIVTNFWLILGILAAVILIKLVVTALIVSLYSKSLGNGLRVGLVLSNCDEFSLILVILGVKNGIIDSALGNVLLIVFILSLMFSTLLILYNKAITFFALSLLGIKNQKEIEADEETKSVTNHIILCGFGETGKNLRNILKPAGIPIVAIDTDPLHVERASALGCHALYGDATSVNTLKSANIAQARALVITFDNYAHTMKLLQKIRNEYPDLPIISRVHEIGHIEDMMSLGATAVFSDGIGISLSMRQEIMKALKLPETLVEDEEHLIREAFKS